MLLISCPSDGGQHEEPEQQRVRPGVADDRDEPVGELLGGAAGLTIAVDSEIMPPTRITVVHEIAAVGLLDAQHAAAGSIAHAASSPATAGGTTPVASSDDHPGEHDERPLGAGAERDGLAAHELRRVDDEHVRVVEVDVERVPRALQQQRVARPRAVVARADVLAAALHGEDDEVAAAR